MQDAPDTAHDTVIVRCPVAACNKRMLQDIASSQLLCARRADVCKDTCTARGKVAYKMR